MVDKSINTDKLKPKQDSQSLYMWCFWQYCSYDHVIPLIKVLSTHSYKNYVATSKTKFPAWLSSEIKILALKCNNEMLILLKQRPHVPYIYVGHYKSHSP